MQYLGVLQDVTQTNYNRRFNELKKIYIKYKQKGKSKFSDHADKEHGMKSIEETITIIHLENNHKKRLKY